MAFGINILGHLSVNCQNSPPTHYVSSCRHSLVIFLLKQTVEYSSCSDTFQFSQLHLQWPKHWQLHHCLVHCLPSSGSLRIENGEEAEEKFLA